MPRFYRLKLANEDNLYLMQKAKTFMMDAYERLYNSTDINMILININEVLNKVEKGMLRGCHGRYHAIFVADTVEYILKSLSYDSRTVELGKIAALLHDIGNIAGRWNHARKSAVLAKVFLDGLEELLPNEKDTIFQAIDDHSDGENILSVIGAALLIADKADSSKRRRLHAEPIDDRYTNLLQIEDADINVSGEAMTIDIVTTAAFSKELWISGYKKEINLMMKAAGYLGCTFHFQFNGIEERICQKAYRGYKN
ncbi:MAG: metal-dependent phosphohydrolase sub domain [Clostridia bacterium]|nr:metal-dependent phosphohydrolase sub domain [Clostridia bacterium]